MNNAVFSPKSWSPKRTTVLIFLLLLSSVISIFFLDHEVSSFFRKELSQSYLPAVKFITVLGLGDSYFMISALGYLLFRYLENKERHRDASRHKENFKFLFFSLLNSGLAVLLFKALIGRERPFHSVNLENLSFSPLTLNWQFQSYPSGHTQVGFTVATVVAILFPRLAIYFWALALLIGLSRIMLLDHFLGDTLAGAAVGIGFTYLTALRLKKIN